MVKLIAVTPNQFARLSDDQDMPDPVEIESNDSLKAAAMLTEPKELMVRSASNPWGKKNGCDVFEAEVEDGFEKVKRAKPRKGKVEPDMPTMLVSVHEPKKKTVSVVTATLSLKALLEKGPKRGVVFTSSNEVCENGVARNKELCSKKYPANMLVIRLASSKTEEYNRKNTIVAGPFKGDGPFVFYVNHATAEVISTDTGKSIRIEAVKHFLARYGSKSIIGRFNRDGTIASMHECQNDGSQIKGVFQWSVSISEYKRNVSATEYLEDELNLSEAEVLLKELGVNKHYYAENYNKGRKIHDNYKSIKSLPGDSRHKLYLNAIIAQENKQISIIAKLKGGLQEGNIKAEYEREFKTIADEGLLREIQAYHNSTTLIVSSLSSSSLRAAAIAAANAVKENFTFQMKIVGGYLSSQGMDVPDEFEQQKQFLHSHDVISCMEEATVETWDKDVDVKLKAAWDNLSAFFLTNVSEEKKLCSLVCEETEESLALADKELMNCHFGTVFAKIFSDSEISSSFDWTIMGKETMTVDSLKRKFGVIELIQRLSPSDAFSRQDYARMSKSQLFNSVLYRIPELFECYKILFGLFWTKNVFVKTVSEEDTQKKYTILRERFEQAFTGIIKEYLARNVTAKIKKDSSEEKKHDVKEESIAVTKFKADQFGVKHSAGIKKVDEPPRFANFYQKEVGTLQEGKFDLFLTESTIHPSSVREQFSILMTHVSKASPDNDQFQQFEMEHFGELLGAGNTSYALATREFLAKIGTMSESSGTNITVLAENILWLKGHFSSKQVSDRKKVENKVMDEALATNLSGIKTELESQGKKVDIELCSKVALFELALSTTRDLRSAVKEVSDKSTGVVSKKVVEYSAKELTKDEERVFLKDKEKAKVQQTVCATVELNEKKVSDAYDTIFGIMNGAKGCIPQLNSIEKIMKTIHETLTPFLRNEEEGEESKKHKPAKNATKNAAAAIKSKHVIEKTVAEAADMNRKANVLKRRIHAVKTNEKFSQEQKMQEILKELKPLISYYNYTDMTITKIVEEIIEWIEQSLNDRVEKKTNHGYEFTQKLAILVETTFNTGRLADAKKYAEFEAKFRKFVDDQISLNKFWAFHCAMIETDSMTVMQGSLGLKPAQFEINKWFFNICQENPKPCCSTSSEVKEEVKAEESIESNLLVGLPTGFGKTSTIMEFTKMLPVFNKIRVSKKQPVINVLFVAFGDHSAISANFIRATEADPDQAVFYNTTTIKHSTKSLENGRVVSGEPKWLMETDEWYRGTDDQCWILIYDELMSITKKDCLFVHKVKNVLKNKLATVHMSGTIGNVGNVKEAISKMYGGNVKYVDAEEGRVIRPVNSVFTKDSIERFIATNYIDWSLSDMWMLFEHIENFVVEEKDEDVSAAKAQAKELMNEVVTLRNLGRVDKLPALTQVKLNKIAESLDKIMKDFPCLQWTNPEVVFPSMKVVVENIVMKNEERPMQALVISETPQKHAYEFVRNLKERMHAEYPFLKQLEDMARCYKTNYDTFSQDFRTALAKSSNGVAVYVPTSGPVDKDGVASKKGDEMREMEQQFAKYNSMWAQIVILINEEVDAIKYRLEHGGVREKKCEYSDVNYSDSDDSDSESDTPNDVSNSSSTKGSCASLRGKTEDPVLLKKQLNYIDSIIGMFLNGRIYNDYHDIEGKPTWSFIPLEYQFGTKNLCGGGIEHKFAASVYGLQKDAYVQSYMHLSNHGIMVLPDDSNQIPTNPNCAMNDANFYKAISELKGLNFCGKRGSVGININVSCVVYLGNGENHKQALGRCGRNGMCSDVYTISVRPVPDHTEVASQSFSFDPEKLSDSENFELFVPYSKKEVKPIVKEVKKEEKLVINYVDCNEDSKKDALVPLKPKEEVKEVKEEVKEEVEEVVVNPWVKPDAKPVPLSMIDPKVASKKAQRQIASANKAMTLDAFNEKKEQKSPLPAVNREALLTEKREKEKEDTLNKYRTALGKNEFPFKIVFPPTGLY